MMDKYFVDKRVGCISVSKVGEKTSNGLHDDLPEVVAYWQGRKDSVGNWDIPQIYIDKAEGLCTLLNSTTADLAIHKKALEEAATLQEDDCKCCDPVINKQTECPKSITCNQCWRDHFLQQAREQEEGK